MWTDPITKPGHPALLDRPASAGWPVLLVGVAARQAASRTATAQARLPRQEVRQSRFAPVDGRFDASTARALAEWKGK